MSDTILGTNLGGRYRLDARIGRGGMSSVYRAFDTVLEREVAIKLMHREIASDSDQLERFRREARAVAQLKHHNIVTVIDVGEWSDELDAAVAGAHDGGGNGDSDTGAVAGDAVGAGNGTGPGGGSAAVATATPYIVLEYVSGETLKHLIRREGRMDVATALAYALEVARALGAAHAHGIVHRDVKPQNILLAEENGAKITDFGIARSLNEDGLTMDGRVLGTTDYVSPEQALGKAVTGQSDVYSLGVVLYEMLTGSVPFRGESPVAVAMMHVREDVPDVQLERPEVSSATAAIVERATAKDLARRYPDMESMAQDMEQALVIEAARAGQATGEVTAVLRTLPEPARQALPWRVRHPARWVATLALLGALVAVATIAAVRHTHSGTGVAPGVRSAPGTHPVVLAQTAASSYNPFGTGPEHAASVSNTIDGDPNTVWSTEHYIGGQLAKPGLGVVLDAAPGVSARAIELQSPTPGMSVSMYGAQRYTHASSGEGEGREGGERGEGGASSTSSSSSPSALQALGWTRLSATKRVGSRTTITFNSQGRRYRYYLIWITALPAGQQSAEISEVTLFR